MRPLDVAPRRPGVLEETLRLLASPLDEASDLGREPGILSEHDAESFLVDAVEQRRGLRANRRGARLSREDRHLSERFSRRERPDFDLAAGGADDNDGKLARFDDKEGVRRFLSLHDDVLARRVFDLLQTRVQDLPLGLAQWRENFDPAQNRGRLSGLFLPVAVEVILDGGGNRDVNSLASQRVPDSLFDGRVDFRKYGEVLQPVTNFVLRRVVPEVGKKADRLGFGRDPGRGCRRHFEHLDDARRNGVRIDIDLEGESGRA